MALTLGAFTRYSVGGRWQVVTPVTVDTSYPTGGWPLANTSLGLPCSLVDRVEVDYNGVTAVSGPELVYDKVNQKLMAFGGAAAGSPGAEITNATNLQSALTNLQVVATGR